MRSEGGRGTLGCSESIYDMLKLVHAERLCNMYGSSRIPIDDIATNQTGIEYHIRSISNESRKENEWFQRTPSSLFIQNEDF